ncbi:MAG: PAS domain-containing protein [Candidatus Pacebacteria bacterium]|nr:PAS domain-containing protein [Candidatus Paceibacterota bacterium]
MNPWIFREYRCHCGKLLSRGMVIEGMLELRCRHCGRVTEIIGVLNQDDFSTIILNDNCRILNVSDSMLELLGFSKEELIGKEFDIIETIDKQSCLEIFKKLKKTGTILFRTNYKNKEGNLIPINAKVIYFRQRDRGYAMIFCKEIKNNFIIIDKKFPEYSDITTHLDTSGNITFIELTKEAKEILRYEEIDILKKSIFDFFKEGKKQEKIDNFKKMAELQKSFKTRNTILSKDGKNVVICSYLIPHYDNFGLFCGFESSNWIENP